ncbi:hypothetical protein [Erythrobacter aureus]|uniref:Uncharacterized protein n=1 Tax=Erythrobacter aureus TaxID=2182384 RepID=A0A345YJ89_9SPHN|nr:hypothetical protein [Erythrobacter aureus]AXK43991.1 hypothetical protein DVR09_16180 [Erythrobacter aureus]
MTSTPTWLVDLLANSPTPREACHGLMFHGTLEQFDGRLKSFSSLGLRWAAEDPVVAQSYCPATSGSTMWTPPYLWTLQERMLPDSYINRIIFRELGFDERKLDIKRDDRDRICSWRVLDGHPTWQQAKDYMASLGYDGSSYSWVKTAKRDSVDVILPADYKAQGRLFILERPADFRVYDYATGREGGLTGRQWNHSTAFTKLAAADEWDAVLIDDVNQSEGMGHFGHPALGVFEKTLSTLRYHVIDAVNFDPITAWYGEDPHATTPEFDALWASCQPACLPLAA